MFLTRSLRVPLFGIVLISGFAAFGFQPPAPATPPAPPPPNPTQIASQEDRQKMMDLLHISSLRPGANGSNPQAPNYANYDESKANPYPVLPDVMLLKNGKKVKTAKDWWDKRRPEIVEDFDREIYGRMPKVTPAVKWEVTETLNETNGGVPVITKKLIGHVDNSAYPQISVDIQLNLSTPANAARPVPVIMEFGFIGPFPGRGPGPARAGGPPPPTGPTWQQQVLAKGWGYAVLVPGSIQADNGAGLTKGIIGLVNKGQPRKPDDWGALRAWAWGASRALDYFETDKAVVEIGRIEGGGVVATLVAEVHKGAITKLMPLSCNGCAAGHGKARAATGLGREAGVGCCRKCLPRRERGEVGAARRLHRDLQPASVAIEYAPAEIQGRGEEAVGDGRGAVGDRPGDEIAVAEETAIAGGIVKGERQVIQPGSRTAGVI